jgi:L-arabinokinase
MVSGYVLQRAPGRDAGIPDWYSLSKTETETGAGPTSKNVATKESAAS